MKKEDFFNAPHIVIGSYGDYLEIITWLKSIGEQVKNPFAYDYLKDHYFIRSSDHLWRVVSDTGSNRKWTIDFLKHNWPEDNQLLSNSLQEFPVKGWCKNPSPELLSYFRSKYKDQTIRVGENGIAWSSGNTWSITQSSSNPVYTMEQLQVFLDKEYPYTIDSAISLVLYDNLQSVKELRVEIIRDVIREPRAFKVEVEELKI